jgi:hypothetical protein
MPAIQVRSSALAIKKETTEGTLVPPSASTDYVALQDGFSIQANIESLENAELRASIGKSKPIAGRETPSANLSCYLRHSGVEGTAPNYGVLLESSLGAVSTAGTEYATAASSTASVLKVTGPNGSTFERGEAVLIKDGVNGYRIRCLDSVNATDLTLGFQLPSGAAPAAGVNLGRCVLYKPVNTGHPTLSLWHYLGNSGAIQAMSGSRVTNCAIEIGAGDLINASFDLEGVGYFFNPLRVTSTNNAIVFDVGGGNVTATVAQKVYKTPHDLAAAMQAAMSTAAAGTYTVVYSDTTGKYTFTKSAGTLTINFQSGANSIGALIGFTANKTGALSYTSDVAISLASPQTPSYDSADAIAAKNHEVMVGLAGDYICFEASSVSLSIATGKADIGSVCSESGVSGSIISSREVSISVTALLNQYDASFFERFRNNTELKFQYSFGEKLGGNWVPGKCGALYVPTAKITQPQIEDADGLFALSLELSAFVNTNGDGEVYVAFV